MSCNGSAQNCIVKNYSLEDGLSQNNITHLLFDKYDRLIIGTQQGVCIFDGLKFHQVSQESISPRISFIFKDSARESYIVDEKLNIFLVNKSIKNLQKLNKQNELADQWLFNTAPYDKIDTNPLSAHIKFFLNNILGYKNIKHFSKKETSYYLDFKSEYLGLKSFFFMDSFLVHRNAQGKWVKFTNESRPISVTSNLPSDIIDKGFFFNTDAETYCLYDKAIFQIKMMNNHLLASPIIINVPIDKIKDQIIVGQYDAKKGIFFFGSSKNGLYKVSPIYFQIRKHSIKREISCAYYSQAEIDSNSILVDNYLIIKDSSDISLPNVIYPYPRAVNLVDNKGWLWYGDDQFMVVKKGNHINKISIAPFSHRFSSMCQLSTSKYLLLNSPFLIEVDSIRKLRIIDLGKFLNSKKESGSYLFNNTFENKLYLLTNRNIYTINLDNEQLTPSSTLKEADYRIMKPLTDSISFVGTYGQGYLLKFGNSYVTMPLDKKEYLKFAHTALVDDHGHVWISTNNGLFRTRLEDMKAYLAGKANDIFYYYYDKSAGFLTNEFNGGCQSPAIRLKNGKFSFSSMDGLVQFDPLKVPASFPQYKPNIISLWLNGQKQDTISTSLVITQAVKDIRLELSSTFHSNPENLVIQYKIPNYVDQWTELTDKRYILLQNAQHGSFNIEIRKSNGFGPDAFDYLNYSVTVLPYFYQTWWFVSLLILVGLTTTYLFSRWYSRYIIKKNAELEALIAKKNAGLLQSNLALTEKIKQNDLFQSILVHDIKAPLRFIASSSDLILNYWPTVTDEIKKENISHIYESAFKIGSFIDETMLWMQIRNGELAAHNSTFAIHDLFVESINLVQQDPKVVEGKVNISISCDASLQIYSDPILISTVMRNLVSNSINYSANGTITLFAEKGLNGNVVFGCDDEGKGMDPELIDVLLSDEYRGNSIRKDSFRMGYVIIKEIVRLLDAHLTIESRPKLGSRVSIAVKIKDHLN